MSRFARLVNAQAAREQETSQAPEEQKQPKETTHENDSNVKSSGPIDTPVDTPVTTGAITPASTPVKPQAITTVTTPVNTPVTTGVNQMLREAGEGTRESSRFSSQYLDATHTASEKSVYSVMYRETVSRGVRERHFGPKELCEKTGIRSDRTVRTALDGLIAKLSIEIISNFNGSPLGPRYRVFEPKEVAGRRKAAGIEIDPQSKKIITPVVTGVATAVNTGAATGDKNYRGTGANVTGVTGVEIAGVNTKYINPIGEGAESAAGSSSNLSTGADDEAYAELISQFRKAVVEVTGRDSSPAEAGRWGELAELLVTELKIAAGRTGSVSSVPAFLTEHLRRRLWKKDKQQVETEAAEGREGQAAKVDASKCPDCFGTGMFYPEGFDKGVARCGHEKLRTAD